MSMRPPENDERQPNDFILFGGRLRFTRRQTLRSILGGLLGLTAFGAGRATAPTATVAVEVHPRDFHLNASIEKSTIADGQVSGNTLSVTLFLQPLEDGAVITEVDGTVNFPGRRNDYGDDSNGGWAIATRRLVPDSNNLHQYTLVVDLDQPGPDQPAMQKGDEGTFSANVKGIDSNNRALRHNAVPREVPFRRI